MPIDWAEVNWVYVIVLSVFALLASLIGGVLSFHNRGIGAVLSAILFAVIFVFWTYYPHGLPLPTSLAERTQTVPAETAPPVPPAPVEPAEPAQPDNPVRDITPPPNQ